MRHPTRRTLILLAALSLVGCGYWQGQPGDIREALSDPDLEHVRLTHTDGSQTEARVVEVRGDTIYGTRGANAVTSCREPSPMCTLRLPVTQVGFVERRRFSLIKSIAMVVVPIGFVYVVAAAGN